jgi:hypothetical protein
MRVVQQMGTGGRAFEGAVQGDFSLATFMFPSLLCVSTYLDETIQFSGYDYGYLRRLMDTPPHK